MRKGDTGWRQLGERNAGSELRMENVFGREEEQGEGYKYPSNAYQRFRNGLVPLLDLDSGKRESPSGERQVAEGDCPQDSVSWVRGNIRKMDHEHKEDKHDAQEHARRGYIFHKDEAQSRSNEGEADEISPEHAGRHPGGDALHDELSPGQMFCSKDGQRCGDEDARQYEQFVQSGD